MRARPVVDAGTSVLGWPLRAGSAWITGLRAAGPAGPGRRSRREPGDAGAVRAARTRAALFEALARCGAQALTGGRLEVTASAPDRADLSHPLATAAGEPPRWLVARRPVPATLLRADEVALTSLAALGSAALARVRLTEEAARHAMDDDLTGLPDRRGFTTRLAAATQRGPALAVLLVDLDDFTSVNDDLGHAAGDELLVEAARRLLEVVGPGGVVGRLGADEFAVLLPDDQPGRVEDVCDAVVAVLAEPFLLGAGPAVVGVSAGVATSLPGDDAGSMLRRAEAATRRAQRAGGSRWAGADEAADAEDLTDGHPDGDRRGPRP